MKVIFKLILIFIILAELTSAQSRLIGINRMGGNGFGTIYKYKGGDSTLSDVLKIKGTRINGSISLEKLGQYF